MSKTKISQYDAISGNNTDIDGINLAEGMAPGLVNNAIRELMSQLKDFQVGSAGDPLTVGGNLAVSGTANFSSAITMSGRLVDAFPAGTRMLFQQTAAPIGWVKDVANNDRALRVVSGTVSSGGTVGFSSAFVSKAVTGAIANAIAGGTVANHTLTIAQIPAHQHVLKYVDNAVATGDFGIPRGSAIITPFEKDDAVIPTGGSQAHNHGFTGISHNHTFTGTAIDLAVQYVDVIICTKS